MQPPAFLEFLRLNRTSDCVSWGWQVPRKAGAVPPSIAAEGPAGGADLSLDSLDLTSAVLPGGSPVTPGTKGKGRSPFRPAPGPAADGGPAAYLQVQYNLTGFGLLPASTQNRKIFLSSFKNAMESEVDATLVQVGHFPSFPHPERGTFRIPGFGWPAPAPLTLWPSASENVVPQCQLAIWLKGLASFCWLWRVAPLRCASSVPLLAHVRTTVGSVGRDYVPNACHGLCERSPCARQWARRRPSHGPAA